MHKPDDSSLELQNLLAVEERARQLLNRASAWDTFPTPIDDIVAAANLRVAPTSLFDPAAIVSYLKNKSVDAARWLKSAVSKVLGVYDGFDNVIHIDDKVVLVKQNFLKLHETGHHELPVHRRLFRLFQDCEKTLSPDIADQFEREANNFARFALFQGDAYRSQAPDHAFENKTPMKLAKTCGASIYATAREFARTNPRACVVYVLEPIQFVSGSGAQAQVRRIEASPSFKAQFGTPTDIVVSLDHALGPVLPIGKRMTRPVTLVMSDRNGERHECIAEAFDTTRNVIILAYPVKALSAMTIILPSRSKAAV